MLRSVYWLLLTHSRIYAFASEGVLFNYVMYMYVAEQTQFTQKASRSNRAACMQNNSRLDRRSMRGAGVLEECTHSVIGFHAALLFGI